MTDQPQGNPIPNCDLQVCVDSTLGQKFLAAVDFPLQIDLGADAFSDSDVEPYLDEEESGEERQAAEPVTGEQDNELEEVIEDVVAYALADGYGQDGAGDVDSAGDAADKSRDKAAADKKRTKVQILSLSLVVPCAPTLAVGNPIVLSDVTVKVHAKIKACVRVFGKWRCVDTSTPWMTLSGRGATLQLSSEGAVVYATPVIEDIDMAVALKIFKWRLKCRLGITKIVNRELRKRGPIQLADLSALSQTMFLLGKQPRIEAITFATGPNGLVIRSRVAVS